MDMIEQLMDESIKLGKTIESECEPYIMKSNEAGSIWTATLYPHKGGGETIEAAIIALNNILKDSAKKDISIRIEQLLRKQNENDEKMNILRMLEQQI